MKRYIIAIVMVLLVAILFHILSTHVHKRDNSTRYKSSPKKVMTYS